MLSPRPYIVRPGDHLAGLACSHGFDAAQVWGDPKNAHLQASGRTPEILAPGDVLYIPDTPPSGATLAIGAANDFSGAVPSVRVTLSLRLADVPIRNEPCAVKGAVPPVPEATDGDGKIALDVSVLTREVEIHFPRIDLLLPVQVGGLDPLVTRSGRRQRLANLGWYALPRDDGDGDRDGGDDPLEAEAAARFVHACGGAEGDAVDDEVLMRHLKDQHGI